MSIASFPGHTPQGRVAWYPRLHMREIIARVYGTGSVYVSVNSLSQVTGVVWRQYRNIVSGRTNSQVWHSSWKWDRSFKLPITF